MSSIIEKVQERYNSLAKENVNLSCANLLNFCQIKPGYICLDLGCGQGLESINLAKKVGPKGHVFALDFSKDMILKAKANAKANSVINISFIQSPIENIPLADKIADLIVSNCTINHAGNKSSVFNEVYRLLKPGGKFVISDIISQEDVKEEYRHNPEFVACCWAGAVTKEKYLTTIKESGFDIIEILHQSKPYKKGEIMVSSLVLQGYKKKGESKL